MKKILIANLIALFALTLWSCNQNGVSPTDNVAVEASRLASDSTGFFCRDSLSKLAVADLPASITGYITANYAGSTLTYAVKDDVGNFLVAITQNGQRKALLFNADGTFNKELAVREGGRGHGGPGRPGNKAERDSINKVTIANLPAAITSYITTNFTSATITMAAKDDTRGYFVMITVDGQRRTLLFNTDGTFNQEIERKAKGKYTAVTAANLPAAITTYLTTNYAGYKFIVAGTNTSGQYLVWIQQSNGRPAALVFAADGTFVQVLEHRR